MKLRLHPIAAVLGFAFVLAPRPPGAQDDGPVPDAKQWRGIATVKFLRATANVKGRPYKAKGQYPIFKAKGPLERFANAKLSGYATSGFREFVAQARREMAAEPDVPGYEYSSAPYISEYKPGRLISLVMITYTYLGGAHGIAVTDGITYSLVNGKPKELTLSDLFLPGANYRSQLEKLIFAKLKKDDRAEWVHDGSAKPLTVDQFNNFVVEKDGLCWTFNPYEMGSFAAGPIDVKLTAKELGPTVRKELF